MANYIHVGIGGTKQGLMRYEQMMQFIYVVSLMKNEAEQPNIK